MRAAALFLSKCAHSPLLQPRATWQIFEASSVSARGISRKAAETPLLKEKLRQLYKLVHPDLLHDFPRERSSNEQSFQVLQEYLSVLESGPESTDFGTPRLYHFNFFIKQSLTFHKDGDEGMTEPSLRKVEMTLPSPQRSRSGNGELPLATKLALQRLFEACGLLGDFTGGLKGNEKLRLSDIFQHAAEMQRSGSVSLSPAERHIIFIRNALRMGREVVASFRPPLAEASSDEQIKVLEKLCRALDRVPDLNLSGLAMAIGDGYGVDPLGNIWLNHCDDVELWAKYLSDSNPDMARERRKESQRRRGNEFLTARAMEVEMVYTDDATGVLPEYTEFLKRMVIGAEEHGAVGAGRFHDLPLRVLHPRRNCERNMERDRGDKSTDFESSKFEGLSWNVDTRMGFIVVPLTASQEEVYKFIESEGDKALIFRQQYKREEKRLKDATAHVRSKLRLRHLACDDKKISNDQFLAACSRMLRYAPEIQNQMEGLSVCISDEHRLPIAGVRPMLHVKWNFSLAEL